jgi:Histone deacetylase domain
MYCATASCILSHSLAAHAYWCALTVVLKQGIARVCVVDFDVHHGNGTEDLLCRVYNPAFFYASVHAYGFAVRSIATVHGSYTVCNYLRLLNSTSRHSLLLRMPLVHSTVLCLGYNLATV